MTNSRCGSIQLRDPINFNQFPGYLDPEYISSDDSSVPSDSSGTDTDNDAPPPRKKKADMTKGQKDRKMVRHLIRQTRRVNDIQALAFNRAAAVSSPPPRLLFFSSFVSLSRKLFVSGNPISVSPDSLFSAFTDSKG